jgi:hypothetical protein
MTKSKFARWVNGRDPVLSDRATSVEENLTLQFEATPGDRTGDETRTTNFAILNFLIGIPTI